jgi:ABC-type multidrug transport system fused ATPase/permease subunit
LSADPVSRFSRVVPRLQTATVAAARLHDLLAETRETRDRPDALVPKELSGALSVADLQFSYPAASLPALSGLDFTVAPGEKVAVVGRNASGKSTLLDVLLRIQEPERGSVLADGMDTRDIRLAAWRAFMGVVPQEILLLNRSVAENIALGSTHSPEQVRAAAIAAGLEQFIKGLPQGYDTVVGERGVFLSGGERQRIAIARLFLRAPRFVLLDEPTSALDVAYESNLLPALRRLCAGRTTFIVSHRLTVLSDVDKVLLLDSGRQLAFDTPAHIWRDFPAYRDLFPDGWGMARPDSRRGNTASSRLLQV